MSTPQYKGSGAFGHVHNEAQLALQSRSMSHCKFIEPGRPDAVVYMHWSDYTMPTKELERLLICTQSELTSKTKIFYIKSCKSTQEEACALLKVNKQTNHTIRCDINNNATIEPRQIN